MTESEKLFYLAAFITAVIGVYLAVSNRRKNEADAAESLSNAAKNLVDIQNTRLDELEGKHIELTEYVAYLSEGVHELLMQLQDIGVKPKFKMKSLQTYKKEPPK